MHGGCGPPCGVYEGFLEGERRADINCVCVSVCARHWQAALLADPVGCLPLALFLLTPPFLLLSPSIVLFLSLFILTLVVVEARVNAQ